MAFGTGEHETTKMCLDLLGEIDVSGKTVIDVGTGSGILGIASILSDAKSAYMCDIDCTAIDTAKGKMQGSITCPTDVKSSAPTFWKRAKNPPTSFLQTLRRTFS
ncbi:MAG: 50S ribosomal protein L11 methyltransferase [Clostridium sp.]|nr:MAG: 50S ribosomal protein L11 methyltransferase [Clostridium sp.]